MLVYYAGIFDLHLYKSNKMANTLPIHLPYHEFQNLNSGINPTAKFEIIEEIKKGEVYIVSHEGVEYRLVVDEHDNLSLTH